MNEVLQWIAAGVIVAIAAIYLVRRSLRRDKGCDCSTGCASCPFSTGSQGQYSASSAGDCPSKEKGSFGG